MREYAFPEASNRGDWAPSFAVAVNGSPAQWDPLDDIVTLALAYPWEMGADDYQLPRNTRPFVRISASSNDASGVVELINPGLISIHVPASTMSQFPQSSIRVALRYARVSDGRVVTFLVGRLPLIEGIV